MIIHIDSVIFGIHFSNKDTMQKQNQSDFIIVDEFALICFFKILFLCHDRSFSLRGNSYCTRKWAALSGKKGLLCSLVACQRVLIHCTHWLMFKSLGELKAVWNESHLCEALCFCIPTFPHSWGGPFNGQLRLKNIRNLDKGFINRLIPEWMPVRKKPPKSISCWTVDFLQDFRMDH